MESCATPRPRIISVVRRIASVLIVTMCAVAACSCAAEPGPTETEVESRVFDPSTMTWSPRSLEEAAPCLVGWRVDGTGGALTALSPVQSGDPVIWRTPNRMDSRQLYIVAVDSGARGMVGELYAYGEDGEPFQRALLFEPDGSVREMPRPQDKEGISSAAFFDAGVIAVAYHATLEEFQTSLGLVAPGEGWTPLELAGAVPEFQFVESVVARPGSSLVGLVLKVSGGPGDRDDDMLVMAELDGSTLTVVTPPFLDDSLPGAQPLLDADGVVYVRLWPLTDSGWTPSLMRVAWTGSGWEEQQLLPPGSVSAGPETGQAVAADASGGFWIRDAGSSDHGDGSRLTHLAAGASAPDTADADLGNVDWFGWVEGVK